MLDCLAKIIEEMGFKKVNDTYTGTFLFGPTGNILVIDVDDLTDDPDDSAMVRFAVYDMDGNHLDTHTLDQMIVIRHTQLKPAEIKWDAEYEVVLSAEIRIPVSLKELSPRDKKLLAYDIVEDEEKFIRTLATDKLTGYLQSSDIEIPVYEHINLIKTN